MGSFAPVTRSQWACLSLAPHSLSLVPNTLFENSDALLPGRVTSLPFGLGAAAGCVCEGYQGAMRPLSGNEWACLDP